jgi:predicted ATPase
MGLLGGPNNMINAIKILNGFATELPNFYPGIEFHFSKGLTILSGSNGCGKTSILKMLKAYCGIPNGYGGWSRISSELALGAQQQSHFPWVYRAYSPGQSDCLVDWDGTATFYNEGDVKTDQWGWFTHRAISSEDGMTTEAEHMDVMIEKPSSGQYRLKKLNKLFNMLKSPPDLREYVSGHPVQIAESNYIRTLKHTGRVTLLLDEPERALALPKQLELFRLLEKMSDEYQIIVATHSPFVCLLDLNAKIIDIEKNYSQDCLDIFENLMKKKWS